MHKPNKTCQSMYEQKHAQADECMCKIKYALHNQKNMLINVGRLYKNEQNYDGFIRKYIFVRVYTFKRPWRIWGKRCLRTQKDFPARVNQFRLTDA